MSVKEVYEDRLNYSLRRKTKEYAEKFLSRHRVSHRTFLKINPAKSIDTFFEVFPVFIEKVLSGEKFDIRQTAYFQYLIAHLHPNWLTPLRDRGIKHVIKKAQDSINLIKDIKKNGLLAPLDMWKTRRGLKIIRGYRRLVILYVLGIEQMKVRVWQSEEIYYRNQTGRIPTKWKKKFSV